jgi:hypothetical protein
VLKKYDSIKAKSKIKNYRKNKNAIKIQHLFRQVLCKWRISMTGRRV